MQPDTNETNGITEFDTLAALKARADLLGVQYHPSIGEDKLREKVNAAMQDDQPSNPVIAKTEAEIINARRQALINSATALVRIKLACMNPAKKDWDGEIFTIGNSIVGSIKKYVPFNSDEAWHVPHILYTMLKERVCQIFITVRNSNGVAVQKSKTIKEFSIEVLPNLTKEELTDLAHRQALSHSTGD